jgi:hypothetical protein
VADPFADAALEGTLDPRDRRGTRYSGFYADIAEKCLILLETLELFSSGR